MEDHPDCEAEETMTIEGRAESLKQLFHKSFVEAEGRDYINMGWLIMARAVEAEIIEARLDELGRLPEGFLDEKKAMGIYDRREELRRQKDGLK